MPNKRVESTPLLKSQKLQKSATTSSPHLERFTWLVKIGSIGRASQLPLAWLLGLRKRLPCTHG